MMTARGQGLLPYIKSPDPADFNDAQDAEAATLLYTTLISSIPKETKTAGETYTTKAAASPKLSHAAVNLVPADATHELMT
jgi:hypothetical protein